MTIVCSPTFVNAAQHVRPIGGVIFTPPDVTARSERGMLTLKTFSFSSSFPLAPVNCSILAVSSFASAANEDEDRTKAEHAVNTSANRLIEYMDFSSMVTRRAVHVSPIPEATSGKG